MLSRYEKIKGYNRHIVSYLLSPLLEWDKLSDTAHSSRRSSHRSISPRHCSEAQQLLLGGFGCLGAGRAQCGECPSDSEQVNPRVKMRILLITAPELMGSPTGKRSRLARTCPSPRIADGRGTYGQFSSSFSDIQRTRRREHRQQHSPPILGGYPTEEVCQSPALGNKTMDL